MDLEQENQTTVDVISGIMNQFNTDMTTLEQAAVKISRNTNRLILASVTVLIICSVIILYLVMNLTNNMNAMIESINILYVRIEHISKNMQRITPTTQNMEQNLQGMQTIANTMRHINGDLTGMNSSVTGMTKNVQSMENNIASINNGVWEIGGRLNSITGAVTHINYNSNQMARPTDMLNPLGWMIPP
ncbi:MAG: hypothetical protein H7839_01765 [Magnetococcus sp. YQC-5]